MTTLLLSLADTRLVRLDLRVEMDEWQGQFSHIEVWRSTLSDAGPFVELTGEAWSSPTLPSNATAPNGGTGPFVAIVGKKLELFLNDRMPLEVTFTGSDPLTYQDCATQVTNALGAYVQAYVSEDGKFVLRAVAAGASTSLHLLGGDAAPMLGLEVDEVSFGRDPRLPLVKGRSSYKFFDYFGDSNYFYRIRLVNATTGTKSAWSSVLSGKQRIGLSSDALITGYVRLVGRDGRPLLNRELTVYAPYLGQQVEDATVVGGPEKYLTDVNGVCEIQLVRGLEVDVAIGGTSLTRRVQVPLDPSITRFDLLAPEYGKDDTFAVKRINLPYAERRNL